MFKCSSITNLNAVKLFLKPALLLCLSLWLTACQTPPLDVYSVLKEGVDVSQYNTFTISDADNIENRYYDYIKKGIIKNLSYKGYLLTEQADLIVRYSLEFKTDEQVKMESIFEQGDMHTHTSMEAVFEAEMLVNIIDTKTKKVIWKAATTRDLKSVNLKKVDQERVDNSIKELFETFPAR